MNNQTNNTPDYRQLAERRQVYRKALDRYGTNNQLVVAIEELSEATKELCKYLRGEGNEDHLIEEVADAMIMLEQVMDIYHIRQAVLQMMAHKAERLAKNIKMGDENNG